MEKKWRPVSFYKNYWVSQSSTLTFPIQGREFLPIFKLTRTRTGMSVNDSDSVLQGKNWGANNAYIVLGNNKLEMVNKVPTEIVRNFVNKLYIEKQKNCKKKSTGKRLCNAPTDLVLILSFCFIFFENNKLAEYIVK